MNRFLNYDQNYGLQLANFRAPNATLTDCVGDIVLAISDDSSETLTYTINGGELDILHDADFFQGSSATIEAIEQVRDTIAVCDALR